MKYLLILCFFYTSSMWAKCRNKIDEKKVMIFVDTNYSDLEIAKAEKAACKRGQVLKVVPENYKEYTNAIKAREGASQALKQCERRHQKDCSKLSKAKESAQQVIVDLQKSYSGIATSLRDTLEDIESKGGKVQNFTISGHDGGGQYSGFKGRISREQLAYYMEAYKSINEVKSVVLLGCYTGVQKEINEWKMIFPGIRIITGFDGTAPLSVRPEGHKFLEDILTQEAELLKKSDEKKINYYMRKNIRGFEKLNSAVYLNYLCEDPAKNSEFYYASKDASHKFKHFDPAACEKLKPKIAELTKVYGIYYNGDKEPPKTTSSGPVRDLYDQARSIEHCLAYNDLNLNVSIAFNLRFYDDVKKNFARYYEKDLSEAESILATIKPEGVEKNVNEIIGQLENEKKKQSSDPLELLNSDPAAYFAPQEKDLEEIKAKIDEQLTDPIYKDLYDRFFLNVSDPYSVPIPEDLKEEEINKFYGLRNQLGNLDYYKKGLEKDKADPSRIKNSLAETIEYYDQSIVLLKNNAQKILAAKIWVPNMKNLAQKTRKETLDNIHKIHEILYLQGLDQKQRSTMLWVAEVMTQHLHYLQNPFDWHEYTGHPISPDQPIPLEGYLKNADLQPSW